MSKDQQVTGRSGKNALRLAVAGATAAVLLGTSFYASQAGAASIYEDDGSTDTAKTVGISLGVAAGTFLIIGAIERGADSDKKSSNDKEKSAQAGAAQSVRVIPSQKSLGAGDSAMVDVQVRREGSQTWESVTNEASIRLLSGGLTQVDGSKNAFAVPYGSKTQPGTATVQASFGGHTATTELQVN